MKIHQFSFSDPQKGGWQFSPIKFRDSLNLLVGESGSGKTRLLNVIFNIGAFVSTGQRFCAGSWEIHFSHGAHTFRWVYNGEKTPNGPEVISEALYSIVPSGEEKLLVERTSNGIRFDDSPVPRLSKTTSLITLFKEESVIEPAFDGFTKIMRRSFSGDDLSNAGALQSFPHGIQAELKTKKSLETLWAKDLSIHTRCYFLAEFFKPKLEQLKDHFQRIFPFVEALEFKKIGQQAQYEGIPQVSDGMILMIREKGVLESVPFQELSSGMQKVLLILTDILTSPKEILYIIDEYENSLGVNAIDFLPTFIAECGEGRQLLVTTHHPALINAAPIDTWLIFNRHGSNVRIKSGQDYEEKFGKSKQQKFIQLLNDPFFSEGVE
jgi:predicted ATPase